MKVKHIPTKKIFIISKKFKNRYGLWYLSSCNTWLYSNDCKAIKVINKPKK